MTGGDSERERERERERDKVTFCGCVHLTMSVEIYLEIKVYTLNTCNIICPVCLKLKSLHSKLYRVQIHTCTHTNTNTYTHTNTFVRVCLENLCTIPPSDLLNKDGILLILVQHDESGQFKSNAADPSTIK